MGYDISKFSPAAQKQIAQKILAQERQKKEKAEQIALEKKESKYHNQTEERLVEDGNVIKFQSKKEARRFDELMLLLKIGEIRDLHLQQNYTLQEGYTLPNGNRIKPIIYKADFVYEKRELRKYQIDGGSVYEDVEEWVKIVEDVKANPTRTRVYGIKKKLLREKFGIEIMEI